MWINIREQCQPEEAYNDATQQAEGCYRAFTIECSEKHKSFKLKIPQPDSERRHSPDFRTAFGIMIGPFSFCEIGKM